MISVRIILDTRFKSEAGDFPLKLAIGKNRKVAHIPVGVRLFVERWNKVTMSVIGTDATSLSTNRLLLSLRNRVSVFIHDLQVSGKAAALSASEIRDLVSEFLSPSEDNGNLFLARCRDFVSRHQKKRTQDIYLATIAKVEAFEGERASMLSFEDITKDWLQRFDAWLPSTGCESRNARNIHLRNIRAVFNDAIDNEVTSAYPFRRFSIRPEATAKRAVSVDELRAFFSASVRPHQQKYVDAFKLIFCLIGINVIDLLSASAPIRGRLEYNRAKTGRFYSVKIEPEAEEIISRYAGLRGHLVSWGENRKDYRSFTMRLDLELKRVGCLGVDGEMPRFSSFTSYVARHSWASIASELDIPKETIAHALGHGGSSVTDVYIDFNLRKVDEANRKVLDWVFHGKR